MIRDDDTIIAFGMIEKEFINMKNKFEAKAEKEREKAEKCFVTIKGVKCYSESDIMDMYGCDIITSSQCDRYIEKLDSKIASKSNITLSERVCQVMNLYLEDIQREIFDTRRYIEATNKENGDAI